MIRGIAYTLYSVTDLARSRKFYEETLGLTLSRNFEDMWIEYDLGSSTFALSTYGKPSGDGASIAFEVDDLDATLAHLREQNVPFDGEVIDSPVCRMALVKDPDGNTLIIHKLKEGAA